MGQVLFVLAVAVAGAALVFGVTVLIMGGDKGLTPAEPDGRSVPLPGARPLVESDLASARFDVSLRGYRMSQVDQAISRAAYDIGYKQELIGVLEAEIDHLRAGHYDAADLLRDARLAAVAAASALTTDGDDSDAPAGDTSAGDTSDGGVPAGDAAVVIADEAVADGSGDAAVIDAAVIDESAVAGGASVGAQPVKDRTTVESATEGRAVESAT